MFEAFPNEKTNKMNLKQILNILSFFSFVVLLAAACSKKETSNSQKSRLQVRLTDNPDPNVKEVWVDIREVIIKMTDSNDVKLTNTYPGVYNLLDLTNRKDTLLADAEIPAGTISQIRLVLGDNNYIVTKSNERINLTTPSAQQSGLKVQIKQTVTGGLLYRLVLDFDAAKSIVKAGNSGKYLLKPVLRILSFIPSGGSIKGVVKPDSITTAVYAINNLNDTVAATFTQLGTGNYFLRDLAAGNYNLSFSPNDTIHKKAQRTASVILGQITVVDTVKLELR